MSEKYKEENYKFLKRFDDYVAELNPLDGIMKIYSNDYNHDSWIEIQVKAGEYIGHVLRDGEGDFMVVVQA